ncbi:L,D-transpeptidase family protein [Halarcobacter sp.]|uniref:L,D-transpeptidase family protein n=1 Tax=Halarcobacter sp. TaxID=2321133 RepID=UPI002AAAE69D|nr:L,D-transpeptidase family protein [Halarcobacter sp.]
MHKVFILFFTFVLINADEIVDTNLVKVDFEERIKTENIQKVTLKKLLKQKNQLFLSNYLLKKYYKNHNYKPFFISQFSIKPMAYTLINEIKNDQVLKPQLKLYFDIKNIDKQLNETESNPSSENLIKLDNKLISIYHKYMLLLSRGAIDWERFQEELEKIKQEEEIIYYWEKYFARKNIRRLLYEAVKFDDINIAISKVNYTFPQAKVLANRIIQLEELLENGGYTKVPNLKRTLKKGNYYPEITLLKKRLQEDNYININFDCKNDENLEVIKIDKNTSTTILNPNPENDCEELFNEALYLNIKKFQKHNGLVADGIVGKNTISVLNKPIEEQINTMRINLERMRWMPRDLGKKYIIVNIADFTMKMYSNNEKILEMEVIVGDKKHPTPIFSHKMSEIILNPYWRIPQSIVQKEIIPNLVQNPNYLQEEDINIHENWDHDSTIYDMNGIDWSIFLDNDIMADDEYAPMRFIQIPGDKNPLGRIKFLFPNKYSVYLHDTPYKYLFSETNRAFSHGCIRLSKPKELLKVIAQEETKIDLDKSEEILKEKNRVDIELDTKIPVHIVYLTSWVDENGIIQFRDDIYNLDKIQEKILYNQESY